MITEVLTVNRIAGFHHYPNASGSHDFLKHPHRHEFVIECAFLVSHDDRQIEIFDQQKAIEEFLFHSYGKPCQFGAMSCEMIARAIAEKFDACRVVVREDGNGGASFSR